MREQWIDQSLEAAVMAASFYSGARKIIRNHTFTITKVRDDLHMPDVGFTKSKMTMLTKNYVHEESRAAAVGLWDGRLERGKYGSVGFHCFSHYVKGAGTNAYWERINTRKGTSKRASVMGPCIQSVSLTLTNKGKTHVDCFYRTTELFKKFPADLVFIRDTLLAPFNFKDAPIESITFHFANVTCHPMYFVTLLPLLEDPVGELEEIKKRDRYFYNWIVKWTARYLCDEYHRGIAKFAQAQRVKMAALQLLKPAMLKKLQKYLRDNHPGHRGDYNDESGDDD